MAVPKDMGTEVSPKISYATRNLGGHLSCSAGMGLGEPSAGGGQEQNGNPLGPGSVGAQAEPGVRDP